MVKLQLLSRQAQPFNHPKLNLQIIYMLRAERVKHYLTLSTDTWDH